MINFSEVSVGELFAYRGYIYKRVEQFFHSQAGWVNAFRQDSYYRLFYDDTEVESLR